LEKENRMRRTLAVVALALVLAVPAAFAADVSLGVDGVIGTTFWETTGTDSVSGLLYGFEGVVNVMFTPQVAGEFKIGYVVDKWNESSVDWDFWDKYISFVGLFKFYVNPTFFVGGGFEYIRLTGRTIEDSFGTSLDLKRSDLTQEDFFDAGFFVLAAGIDLIASPRLVVPIAANFGYGVINMPDETTRWHFYGTVGLRFLL
jgi:hypothetical protein